MDTAAPIGIFDSGVGGTSIWQEIHHLLPYENTLFLADSKHAPYGNKTKEEIIELSCKNTEYLIAQGCKIIVVACNTATTNAISVLRKKYRLPFIGIEPAIKPAALQTKTKSIGILATRGTLASDLFHKTTDLYTQHITVTEVIGEGLVALIEKGDIHSPEMTQLLRNYMKPMLEAQIDHLVLGCSHYPYLIPQLQKMLPKTVKIIDSGAAVARQTKTILQTQNILSLAHRNLPKLKFYSNSNLGTLQNLLSNYTEKILIEQKDF